MEHRLYFFLALSLLSPCPARAAGLPSAGNSPSATVSAVRAFPEERAFAAVRLPSADNSPSAAVSALRTFSEGRAFAAVRLPSADNSPSAGNSALRTFPVGEEGDSPSGAGFPAPGAAFGRTAMAIGETVAAIGETAVAFGGTSSDNPPSADGRAERERYVEKYAAVAVAEMYRSGVPASITLAQGLIESDAGRSGLARLHHNHFGIKCHGWKGGKAYYDDDLRNECFRAYDEPEASFRDHSDFLRYRDRYKFLFDYDPTDYRAWAKGLKKAGYATDPRYAEKLIACIEELSLFRYDTLSPEEAERLSAAAEKAERDDAEEERAGEGEGRTGAETEPASGWKARRVRKKAEKEARRRRQREMEEAGHRIPDSPWEIERPKVYRPEAAEIMGFPLSRPLYSRNGVPYVTAMAGETVLSIAEAYDLFPSELLRFNEMQPSDTLKAGDIVYLQAKKKQAAKGLDLYIVDRDGESLREISRRFAVRLKSVCRMNGIRYSPPSGRLSGKFSFLCKRKERPADGFEAADSLRAGTVILLRKRK